MTSGSLLERASKAAGDALNAGATPLQARFLGYVAAFDTCFQTDRQCAAGIIQRNGRNPHPRSVARVRRQAAAAGWLESVRILPGHKPPGARFTSTGGTTSKRVNFRGLGTRDPLTRGERRRLRRRQESIDATASVVQSPDVTKNDTPQDRPRHSAPIAPPEAPPVVDELSRVIAQATDAMRAKWQREEDRHDLAMMRSVVAARKDRGPPE